MPLSIHRGSIITIQVPGCNTPKLNLETSGHVYDREVYRPSTDQESRLISAEFLQNAKIVSKSSNKLLVN